MKTLRYATGVATLVLGVLGAFLLWDLLDPRNDEGALRFSLLFQDSEGLNLGADIRYRGVSVGEVVAIELAPGGQAARVDLLLRARYRDSVFTTTQFWVVRPRFEGIREGVSGLETLLKDSYVTYRTPPGNRESLPHRAIVQGLENPPVQSEEVRDAVRTGDLQAKILFEESGGLQAGAAVRCRGIRVGEVLSLGLHPSEQAVEAIVRIRREYRPGVTDGTRFWIARPNFTAGLWKGVDINDLDTLVGGVHVAYVTPPRDTAERGTPARDEAVFVGVTERPDLEWDPAHAIEASSKESAPDPEILEGCLVSVSYSFLEVDWFSADDPGYEVSPGILYQSRDHRALVVVARSGIEGAWIAEDGTGEPEIENELWRVTLPDGSVYGAKPVWVEEAGLDLALLVVEGTPPSLLPPMSMTHDANAPVEIIDLVDGERRHLRATLDADRPNGVDSTSSRGLVLQGGRAIGILGRKSKDDAQLSWVALSKIPVALQPKPDVVDEK